MGTNNYKYLYMLIWVSIYICAYVSIKLFMCTYVYIHTYVHVQHIHMCKCAIVQ